MLAYTYNGIQDVVNQNVDRENGYYYIEHAETSARQVVVNQERDIRLNEVLADLETRVSGDAMLPSQVGNSGKFLSTNGSSLLWSTVDNFPLQTGNDGKVLFTNGVAPYWDTPLQLTSTVYPSVSTDTIGSYGVSNEAARADHKHPLPVSFREIYRQAVGGETEITLTGEEYPLNDRPEGFHLYRNGLLLTENVDYTFQADSRKIVFTQACGVKENIIIVLGYFQGYRSSQTQAVVEDVINEILTPDDIPVMDGVASIGTSSKAANALHRHPTDTSRAPINSPTFTGIPSITTTPTLNDNTHKIADTAFVINQLEYFNNNVVENIIPDQTDKANLVLSTDGEHLRWVQNKNAQELPDYSTAETGDILTIDANRNLIWSEISTPTVLPSTTNAEVNEVLSLNQNKNPVWRHILEIPDISNQTNKVLSNNGSSLIWLDNTSIQLTTSVIPSNAASRAYIGSSTEAARADHIHLSDETKANIDSPNFTGTPTSPTPSLNDNSTKIATTEFVNNKISSNVTEMLNNLNYDDMIKLNDPRLVTLKNVVETLQDKGNLDDIIDIDEETGLKKVVFDFSQGNVATLMITDNVKLEFAELPQVSSSNFREVTLILYAVNDHVIDWPKNIHWHNNEVAPRFETVMTIVKLITIDNGSSWYGNVFCNAN